MKIESAEQKFGCDKCLPEAVDAAWEAARNLPTESQLIDESHCRVSIHCCLACSQRYLRLFTEMIDWADGEDSMYWTIIPITDPEAAEIVRRGETLDASTINAVGTGRRSLRRDYPKGDSPHVYWGHGIYVGPHD